MRWQSDAASPHAAAVPRLPSRTTYWELPTAWYGMSRHAETGVELPLRINSLGLRGAELTRFKSPGVLRVLCIGDETTLAEGLNEEECYPGQVAARLRTAGFVVELMQLGLPGGCPLTEYVHYRRLLAALRPDVVLVHVDLSDATDDLAARPLLHVDAASEPVAVAHPTLDVAASALARYSERFAIAAWLERRIGGELVGAQSQSPEETFQRQVLAWSPDDSSGTGPPVVLQPLAQWKSALDAEGVRLVASTCPSAWQTAELLRSPPGADGHNAVLNAPGTELAAACRQWGIPCIDVTPAILRHPEPARLFLRGGAGLSTEGHALYAEELVRALTGSPAALQTASPEVQRR